MEDEAAPWDLAAFIRAHLPLRPVPGGAGMRVHGATPSSGLRRLAERDDGFGSPYWAHAWGGGLVLVRYILDHPASVAGRRVLDLGAGSGVVGVAAAMAGASSVLAADVDPNAIVAIGLNAAANQVRISARLGDWTTGSPPDVDLIAVGDLFYERGLARRVTAYLDRCAAAGVEVLIGDPWRAHLPRSRLRLLAEYPVLDFGDAATKPAGVFAFAPRKPQRA